LAKGWPRRVKSVYMLLISFLYRSYILSICSGFMDHCGFLSIDRPLTGYFGYPHGFAGNYTFKPTQMTLQAVVGFRDKELRDR
jgi:hypothetical protein